MANSELISRSVIETTDS